MKQLKIRDQGPDVITLQTKLGITADGIFGPTYDKIMEINGNLYLF